MGHARGSYKSNKDTDERKEFELCFPRRVCLDEITEFHVDEFDWSESSAGPLGPVLAVDFAE